MSELIAELQKVRNELGDIPVICQRTIDGDKTGDVAPVVIKSQDTDSPTKVLLTAG